MLKVDWSDNYSVGIDEIDNQHKKLFDILNILIESKELRIHSKNITNTLTKMVEYANYHFQTEEKYMLKYKYPEYALHKKEHKEFIKKTGHLCMATMEGNEMVPIELLTFLESWLVNHILKTDMKLKPFFLDKNIKQF
ncbi:MAG: hemerythrin [Ignavibacteriae bacterium HGW-Ignavibacteriae-3]|nr:MAG: hemerythrin [Ignavibacteriae bacterium HGW-Ignavibacteriae-3]